MNILIITYILFLKIQNFLPEIQSDKLYFLVGGAFFLISALGIIFNPAIYNVKANIKADILKIDKKINQVTTSVTQLSNDVNNHNIYITKFLSEKEVITSLENIVETGLSYVDENKDIYVYINEVGRMYILLMNECIDAGIDNLNERILKNKLLVLNKVMYKDKKYLVSESFIKKLKYNRFTKKHKNREFIENVTQISNDIVNSKTDRFRVLTELYLHELLRDIIIIYNDIKNE